MSMYAPPKPKPAPGMQAGAVSAPVRMPPTGGVEASRVPTSGGDPGAMQKQGAVSGFAALGSAQPPAPIDRTANVNATPMGQTDPRLGAPNPQTGGPSTFTFPTMPPPPPVAPATPPPPMPSQPLTIQGQSDPAYLEFIKAMTERTKGLQQKENAPVSWSAERATDLANRDIFGGAAGAKQRKMEELSERGLSGGRGVGAGQVRAIDEAAMTRSARAASDIGLAREKEQDQLNLQREGAVNSLYGALGNFGQVPFEQTLRSGNQSLEAFRTADQAALERARLAESQRTNTAGIQNQQANQQQNQLQNWLSLMKGLQ